MSHLKPIRPTRLQPPTFDEEDGTKIIGALPRNLIRSIDRFQGRLIPKKKMASRLAGRVPILGERPRQHRTRKDGSTYSTYAALRGAVLILAPERFARVAVNRLYPSRYVREAAARRELIARQVDDAIRWAKSLEEDK